MPVFVRVLNAAGMMVLPVLLGVYLARRTRISWSVFFAGAGTFLLSQLLHIPANQFLLQPLLDGAGVGAEGGAGVQLLYSLALGFSAGLFEETARFAVLRFGLKSARDWKAALMFGAGHGGIEAFLLGGVALAALVQVTVFNTPEYLDALPASQRDLLVGQIDLYWSQPWYAALLGFVERVFAVCFHLSAAGLVMQVFRRRNILWLLAAIVWHTALDAVAVFALLRGGVFVSEAMLAGLTVGSIAILLALRPKSQSTEDSTEGASPVVPGLLPATVEKNEQVDIERIEESRFE